MARALLFLVIIGLAVYALADIASSDEHARRGIPRGVWLVVALVPVVGAVVWIASSRAQRAAGGGAAGGGGTTRPGGPGGPRRGGPVAPDDDPEFLWRLEQDRLRREREARRDDDPRGDDDPRPTGDDVSDEGTRG